MFKTVGDAFCVAFATGPEAIAAAIEAQRALAFENWETVGGLPVRMALHTGNADERDGDYFGPTVNRVSRLLSIAHGGQIIASGVTADLVQGQMPAQAALRDLGQHRLKDLAYPEQVYQVVAPGLQASFPPPKSLDTYRHNLPQQLSSFVGREDEIAQIESQLESARLVTLVGTGGVGKTRISLQVGADVLERYPDGVWLVELAPVRELGSIEGLLASILGVESTSGGTTRQALVASLRGKRALLIFDNCEHVVRDAASLIEALLVAIPTLRVLASSREGLGIAGESMFRMPSLAVPPPGTVVTVDDASRFGALALFGKRRRQRFHAHRAAGVFFRDQGQVAAVHRIEAALVHIEAQQGGIGHLLVDGGHTRHLREVAHPAQQAAGDAGGAARALGDFRRAIRRHRHFQHAGAARHDLRQLRHIVELQPQGNAEALAQRRGEQAGAGSGADQGKARQIDPHGARRRALPDDEIELEILHRRVENFLDRRAHAVDFIDEQHIMRFEVGEDRRQIAGLGDYRAGSRAEAHAQLFRHDLRQRGLAEAGRAEKQGVIKGFTAFFCCFDEDREVLPRHLLADEVGEALRPKRGLVPVFFLRARIDFTLHWTYLQAWEE